MIKGEVSQLQVITKITQQKRLKNRFNIFLDKEYAFSVDEEVLITYALQKDQTLSEEKIAEIMDSESYQKAYLMAVNYISYRMRSEKEVRTHLRDKEIGKMEIDKIIDTLLERKYLNDAQFSLAFVKDKMNQTTKGPRMIKQELFEKGVTGKVAEDALSQYAFEAQFDVAFKWAAAQLRRKSRDSHRNRRDKVRASLMQKGFAADVIQAVLEEVNNEVNPSEEDTALIYHGERLLKRHARKCEGFELINKVKSGLYARGFSAESIDAYIAEIEEEMVQ